MPTLTRATTRSGVPFALGAAVLVGASVTGISFRFADP